MTTEYTGARLFRKENIGEYFKRVEIDPYWFALVAENYNKTHTNVSIVHKPCFDHFMEKFSLCPMYTGRINKKSVSCYYCKTKTNRDLRVKIGFIFDEK